MAYQEVNKNQVKNGFQCDLSEILEEFETGVLAQEDAELLSQMLAQKAYEEACKVIDPDKEYPPLRF